MGYIHFFLFRYKNERLDDLRDMEASFTSVMKEEQISKRLAIMEDAEELRKGASTV